MGQRSPSNCRLGRCRKLDFESLEGRRLLAFNPTAFEQEFLQLTNRLRSDPQGEFQRLFSSASPLVARDPTLQLELDYFGVDGQVLRSELAALSSVPPVGWNAAIYDFTLLHNQAMIQAVPPAQFHSDTLTRRQALLDAGVPLRIVSGERINSENVFGFAKSPLHLYASFAVDWGQGPAGMQAGRSHREALTNGDFEQVGHAISRTSLPGFGPLVSTQVLANIQDPPSLVVGAIFEDDNDSGWYEAGEGIGRVQLVFESEAGRFSTTSLDAGGYQLELPAGSYRVTATGGGMLQPVIVDGVQISDRNVWQNLIYDPLAIPPDALEPNPSRQAASPLTGRDQTVAGLSIHLANDEDYFAWRPQSSSAAEFAIQFSHAAGDLGLQWLNASGEVLATANTAGDVERLTVSVLRDRDYYLRVYGVQGATNRQYQLHIDAPEPQPPVAKLDRATVSNLAPVTSLDVLANDVDPDGSWQALVPQLAADAPPNFVLNAQRQVIFTATAGYSGFVRTTYTLTDDQGLVSSPGTIEVLVIDFAAASPWQNPATSVDVNGDHIVSGLDALLIINDINFNEARRLPMQGDVRGYLGFLDTSGNGFVSGLDVLLVINAVNAQGDGEGEAAHDAVLGEWFGADDLMDRSERRRRWWEGDTRPT